MQIPIWNYFTHLYIYINKNPQSILAYYTKKIKSPSSLAADRQFFNTKKRNHNHDFVKTRPRGVEPLTF